MKPISMPKNRTISRIRDGFIRAMTVAPVDGVWSRFLRGRCTILMFHRFRGGEEHHSVGSLWQILRYLRKRRYAILDLEEVVRAMLEGAPVPSGSVVITCDDGYEEQFGVALPVLAEFDIPATFFLTTGFTDGDLWLWWDQIEYLLAHTHRRSIDLDLNGEPVHYDLSSERASGEALRDLTKRCKEVANGALLGTIEQLARAAECDLPASPPAAYRPLTWDQARIAERFGIRFAPGTVSHPVLAKLDDARAAWETTHSWQRVSSEVARPVPIFCYPNGKYADFGRREIELCASAGLIAAVTAEPGYLVTDSKASAAQVRFLLPRFSVPQSLPELVRLTSGLQAFLASLPRRNGASSDSSAAMSFAPSAARLKGASAADVSPTLGSGRRPARNS